MAHAQCIGQKALFAGDRHHFVVTLQFGSERSFPKASNLVVDAALIIYGRIDLLVAFTNETGIDHPADRAVERPWPHFHFSLRIRLNLLHNPIAMPLPGTEREQDM